LGIGFDLGTRELLGAHVVGRGEKFPYRANETLFEVKERPKGMKSNQRRLNH